ncbi:transposon Tn7 transposition protein TnsB [Elysia marginata]|uniref:Transposon Tn7 transposition protein TnsB n=1 Tax=Elysia marginata TaxID=1093978 RepID=A0AAV4I8H5_9GAST|nr:transposon Tn7 transposition protein TnsB [Elysia marginata]
MFSSTIQEACYPGSIFEIDATIGNVYLLSSYFDYDDPIEPHEIVIIGRPVIYHIIDVFSRMTVALFIGVEGPSWDSASQAIRNLFLDKRTWCKQYGINLDDFDNPAMGYTGEDLFPTIAGLPEILRCDHGEFRAILPEWLVTYLGLTITNHQVYCPDLKGTVEQSFSLTQHKGEYTNLFTVEQSFKVRDQILGNAIDPRRGACLTLHEFIALYLRIVLNLNASIRQNYPLTKDMISKGIPPIPVKLWQYGIENLGGALRKPNIREVDKALLLRKECSTTKEGIRFYQDQFYHCSYAEKKGWFEKGNYQKVTLAYNPHSMDECYLVINNQGKLEHIPCHITPRCKDKYCNTSFYDSEFIFHHEQYTNSKISYDQNQRDTTEQYIDQQIEQAKTRIPDDGNKPSSWSDMSVNRKEEADKERAQRNPRHNHDDSETHSQQTADQTITEPDLKNDNEKVKVCNEESQSDEIKYWEQIKAARDLELQQKQVENEDNES